VSEYLSTECSIHPLKVNTRCQALRRTY